MDLQHLDAARGHARQFIQCRLAVVGVDGGDGDHFRMLRGEREQAVVAGANAGRIAGQGLVRAAEPHHADGGELDA